MATLDIRLDLESIDRIAFTDFAYLTRSKFSKDTIELVDLQEDTAFFVSKKDIPMLIKALQNADKLV